MVELVGSLNLDTIRAAHERIRPYIHRTPILTNSWLNDACRASLFFKCENFQKVGAFKARGATNAVFALNDETSEIARNPGVYRDALKFGESEDPRSGELRCAGCLLRTNRGVA